MEKTSNFLARAFGARDFLFCRPFWCTKTRVAGVSQLSKRIKLAARSSMYTHVISYWIAEVFVIADSYSPSYNRLTVRIRCIPLRIELIVITCTTFSDTVSTGNDSWCTVFVHRSTCSNVVPNQLPSSREVLTILLRQRHLVLILVCVHSRNYCACWKVSRCTSKILCAL